MHRRSHTGFWASPVCHPLPLSAALLMAVNDHWLKGAPGMPAWLSGILSDIAGLFFFPLFLCALLRGGLALLHRRPLAWAECGIFTAVAAIFAAANSWPWLNQLLCKWCGEITLDPLDLLALPALAMAWIWLHWSKDEEEIDEAIQLS